MPNLALILKAEISRIARKEIRSETIALKKAVTRCRAEIAALKRMTQALEMKLRPLAKPATQALVEEHPARSRRFSARGLLSQRRRLGISARDCGTLIGASSQSIYNWEEGKTRPLARHLAAIAALGGLGKKEARSIIESRRT